MLSATKQKIINFLEKNPDSSPGNIINYLDISKQAVARHLKELNLEGYISKKGNPPKVYYFSLDKPVQQTVDEQLPLGEATLIEANFVLFTAEGNVLPGLKGFRTWCENRQFNLNTYAKKYITILNKYKAYKNSDSLIEATEKVRETYKSKCYLDKLFYSEFSAYEVFGRTRLYSYLLYGKQSENKSLIKQTVSTIYETILKLIIREKIDAVGFIPPTVPRQIQFQKEFERNLNLPLPVIKIEKVKNNILIPQKTLKSPIERIENSIKTIVVPETRTFQNILLIDDFVGSGATLNFTAQKLKSKFPQLQKVIGYAICGTPNGVIDHSQKFEVVNEV